MTQRLLRRLQIVRYVALAVIVMGVALARGGIGAQAVQAQPATAWSWYVQTANPLTIGQLGCNQGNADRATNQNSEVILDFGVQWSDNSKTLTVNGIFLPISTIETMVESFVDNYYTCTGSDYTTSVKIGIGTNNSTSYESSSMGTGWAQVATDVKNWLAANCCTSQYILVGANDIEPSVAFSGTNSMPRAINWANGFNGHGSTYVNYGSADGCPPYGSCNNGWNQNGIYQVSWGISAAYALPEIYYQSQANQWAQISVYARNNHLAGPVYDGPLDEYDLNTGTFSAAQAWTAFWNALNSAGVNSSLTYSAEIHRTATN